MKKFNRCSVEYNGYDSPENPDELNFEILGLESAIAECNKRIASLKQSLLLAKMSIEELKNDNYCEGQK